MPDVPGAPSAPHPWTPSRFAAAFREHRTPLVQYVLGIVGDGPAAHDLVQDTFADVWADGHDPSRPLRPLLFSMARNRALNHVRNRNTRSGKHDEIRNDSEIATLPTDTLDAAPLAERLAAWVRALPERQREALTLTRFRGLSHTEAADVMGLSPRTVNNHLVRALATLRDRLAAFDPDLRL
ncbi:MAG: sigma-70 family RNA polymerase sigma factor [Bacteroidota bacterium]